MANHFGIPKIRMSIRRRKRGRPRTGRQQVVPVRLPPKMIKTIARVAAVLDCDRSKAIRWMIECSLDSGQVIGLLRSRRGRSLSEEIAGAMLAEQRAHWAAEHASSATPAAKPHAEIRALRAAEKAEGHLSLVADRIAVKRALKSSHPATDRVEVRSVASRRPLTRADIDAAVARAEERSKKANQSQ